MLVTQLVTVSTLFFARLEIAIKNENEGTNRLNFDWLYYIVYLSIRYIIFVRNVITKVINEDFRSHLITDDGMQNYSAYVDKTFWIFFSLWYRKCKVRLAAKRTTLLTLPKKKLSKICILSSFNKKPTTILIIKIIARKKSCQLITRRNEVAYEHIKIAMHDFIKPETGGGVP